MSRHPATVAFLALTGLFALGAFVQPYTAGLGIFGGSFDFHTSFGWLLLALTVLALVAALVSPDRRRDAPWGFALVVLVGAQTGLVEGGTGIAALHPFLGVAALLLALAIHLRARMQRLQGASAA